MSCVLQGGRGSTPSRLQQASTAAPRQPLHDLQGTLAGRLLAEAGMTSKAHLSDACRHPDHSTLTMTSKSAASFKVKASLHLMCSCPVLVPSRRQKTLQASMCHHS